MADCRAARIQELLDAMRIELRRAEQCDRLWSQDCSAILQQLTDLGYGDK